MKLATFTPLGGGATRIGVVVGDEIVDLAGAAPDLPREMSGEACARHSRRAAGLCGSPPGDRDCRAGSNRLAACRPTSGAAMSPWRSGSPATGGHR